MQQRWQSTCCHPKYQLCGWLLQHKQCPANYSYILYYPNTNNQLFYTPGFYTVDELIELLNRILPSSVRTQISESGIVTMSVEERESVFLRGNLLERMLGFDDIRIEGKYVGSRPAFIPAPHRLFYICLDQLSTSTNLVDGTPSTLVAVVPATTDARNSIYVDFAHPIYKKLQVGDIHQLNLRV